LNFWHIGYADLFADQNVYRRKHVDIVRDCNRLDYIDLRRWEGGIGVADAYLFVDDDLDWRRILGQDARVVTHCSINENDCENKECPEEFQTCDLPSVSGYMY